MFCEKCGIEIKDEDRFCYRCGHKKRLPDSGDTQEAAVPFVQEDRSGVSKPCIDATASDEKKTEPGPAAQNETAQQVKPGPSDDTAAVREKMEKDIRGWGIGLIVMGILSVALPQLLDPVWGVIIIVLGIINLIVKERGMYIVNGIALIFIGILNFIGTVTEISGTGPGFFAVYGVLQVFWGIKELVKYGKYGKLLSAGKSKRKMSKSMQLLISIPVFYIVFGGIIALYELLVKAPWYAYTNFFGETLIMGQDPVTGEIPAFIKIVETIFYPVLSVFRAF
ncbi:MAG: hypothetical protein BWY11_00945 [Firmicutes bacterium ADurb.Bin182]|nr:MAG: hypothetical protein BWY11_00945 [Firmicutes bacterium ADurb.Bin182]